jgi:hypothetical protein
LGQSNAVNRIGYLHSHAQVIEGVLSGRYDVGVAIDKAFYLQKHRGLVAIPGTEFQSSRSVTAARPNFDAAHAQAIIKAMTGFHGAWLEAQQDHATFQAFNPSTFAVEDQWLDQVATLFPPKPSPLRSIPSESP